MTARVELRGAIVSTGFASGHRVVVGHWRAGPLGPMTDVMWAAPDGRRTLLAPTPEAAAFITSVYDFDTVEVVEVRVAEGRRELRVEAGPLHLRLEAGRRLPIPSPGVAWVTRWIEAPVARRLLGVVTYGVSPRGVREWYRARSYARLVAASGRLRGEDLGPMTEVAPATRFGFSEPPRRPSWVEVRPLLEGALTPTGG